MSDEKHLHLDVTLDLAADTINGTINDDAGPTVEFTGYLELMSAFDTMTARATNSSNHEADPGATTGPTPLTQETEPE